MDIVKVARDYVYRRFPSASFEEKEKIVKDWENKIAASKSLVSDFKNRVADPAGKKIIDVGCGNGGISIAFALAGAKVTGLEIEEELFEISKEHAAAFGVSPEFVLYSGDQIPFEDNTFDFANSSSVLEHTTSPENYLSEILRVLKPGGILYLGFPNKLMPRETHTQLLFLTYLPAFLRPFYIKLLKRNPLEDNNLHFYSFFDLGKMLCHIASKKTGYHFSLIREDGQSANFIKLVIKRFLNLFGISYKAFLPHILVLLKKEKDDR